MIYFSVLVSVIFLVNIALTQNSGSGTNGNLRLCVVEGRGTYKRASKFCPVLDTEGAGVECVLGTDRLDCLRRMSKGTVDFGVFSPEDLIAAQWADLEVLVTNEIRQRQRPFERSIVCLVNRRILPETATTAHAVLKGTTLCHPGHGADELRPISDTVAEYLESAVTAKSCDPKLSMKENRIKALSEFFGKACKAGPWVDDKVRDAELKSKYPSLCAVCDGGCVVGSRFWGSTGALACVASGAGDVAWPQIDDVRTYFSLDSKVEPFASPDRFAYLCADGTWQPLLDNPEPCVWLNRPWPVVVSKSKVSPLVSSIVSNLTSSDTSSGWRAALSALLESSQAKGQSLLPEQPPLDYLSSARGFREAYSQSECQPPRHINICAHTAVELSKCTWLSEAAAVYGVTPGLQCVFAPNPGQDSRDFCLEAVASGRADITVETSDLLVTAQRDFSLTAVLHEVTPIVEKMNTVFAYVRNDGRINKMSDLRGKKASFPLYDGFAWHSVLDYITKQENIDCMNFIDYFEEICAPGVERLNVSMKTKEKLTKNCYMDGDFAVSGEEQALRAVLDGRSHVAFISMATYNKYTANQIREDWAREIKKLTPICPEGSGQYCFLGWSSIGHIFVKNNLTEMRKQEIVNVFTKLDKLFGKNYPFHNAMFSMYGAFNHRIDVLFHNNTRFLGSDTTLESYPYSKIPLNLERNLKNVTKNSCHNYEFSSSVTNQLSISLIIGVLSLVSLVTRNS